MKKSSIKTIIICEVLIYMLYNTDFAIAGLVLMLVLFLFLNILYDQNITTIILLRRLLIFLILADIFDIITAFTISYPYSIPLWLNYLLNIIFFESEVICISLFPKYIHAIINNANNNIFDRINSIIVWIYAIVCASTPINHYIFFFDENRQYQHGRFYIIIFVLPLYFLLFALTKMFFNRKSFSTRQYYTIIGFVLCAILGPILQALLPGNRIIDFFALSIAAFLAVIGLETPDFLKLEKALDELNKNRELLEKAKKDEEERNKIIHEMTKSASWSIHMDKDHNVTKSFWSDEFFWMLGYERDEIEEESMLWSQSLHPEDAEKSSKAFMNGLQGIDPYDIYYRLKHKNGEYRWYRGTGELKINEAENTFAYHGIIQDVNDEKLREELVNELEKSETALKAAVKRAEAADQAKSDFLANMSHEIRTPLNAVLGMNELISRESTEDNIIGYAANVADAGNALLSLINDILDFSKIEAGKMELVPANYELSVLVREIHNIMNLRFVNKGLDFIINCNPKMPNKLFGDEVRIRQILINILNNALKYTDNGSVSLSIDCEKNNDNSLILVFTVSDTGIGIKEENLANLFKAFTRIDLQHNRKKEGTGLGLSITHSFVSLMGGSIDVTSKYKEGSTFTVKIPQTIIDNSTIGNLDITKNNIRKKDDQTSFIAPDAKILVVDDILMNLEIVKGLLKPNEIHVDIAASGQECLDAIANTKYDIILLDHMMPEMDGIETMKHIKKDSTHPNQNSPVIMLTANAIIGAKDEYLKIGFTDYLSKPIQPNELEAMIIKYLPEELKTTY